jgi:hypothetical protein
MGRHEKQIYGEMLPRPLLAKEIGMVGLGVLLMGCVNTRDGC